MANTSCSSLRAILRSLLRAVQSIWSILGISLLLLLLFEGGLRLLVHAMPEQGTDESSVRLALATSDAATVKAFASEEQSAFRQRGAGDESVRWQSYVYWRSKPLPGPMLKVDRAGHRHTIQPPIVSGGPAPLRIAMFGGSSLFGQFVRDPYTIPSLVARELAERGVAAAVQNYGEPGYVSTQEIISLLVDLQNGNIPDLVVFYNGVNDIGAALQNLRPGLSINEHHRQLEFGLAGSTATSRLLRLLPQSLVLYHLFQNPMEVDSTVQQALARGDRLDSKRMDDLADRTLSLYANNIRMLHGLATEYRFGVLWYWQPLAYVKSVKSQREQSFLGQNELFEQFAKSVYSRVTAAARGSANFDRDHPLASIHYLGEVFDSSKWANRTAFIDFVHTTEPANLDIAQTVASDIQQLVTEKPGQKKKAGSE